MFDRKVCKDLFKKTLRIIMQEVYKNAKFAELCEKNFANFV